MLTDYHLNRFLLGNNLKLLSMRAHKGGAVWLRIHKHRLYCKDCKKVFVEPVDGIWPRRRSTQRFRHFIAQCCGRMNDMASVCRFYSVSQGFAYKTYYEQTAVKLREYQSAAQWPEVVGLDEHFFKRQKNTTEFVSVLTNLKKRRIFNITRGKTVAELISQLEHIPGRDRVHTVVIDMSSTYKSFAKQFFPNAKMVADKFHVLRLITPHIMKTGKDIHGHRQELKTRRKPLRSRINLDYFERQEIDRHLVQHPKLNELYRLKEQIYEFYRTKGYARAQSSFEKLLEKMKHSKLEEVQKLLATFRRWKHEILKYFENGYTRLISVGSGMLSVKRNGT